MGAASASKTQRLLDLLSFLAGRRSPATAEQILTEVPAYAERWREGGEQERKNARRLFERDKRALRDLDVPLEAVECWVDDRARHEEGYVLRRGAFYLPYLGLLRGGSAAPAAGDGDGARGQNRAPGPTAGDAGDGDGRRRASGNRRRGLPSIQLPEEDVATATAALRALEGVPGSPLERDARSALRKLTFDLDPALADHHHVAFADPFGTHEARSALRTLFAAVGARQAATFEYYAIRKDEVEQREVEPRGLFFQHGRWYLVARDRDRDALRTFRVDRMDCVQADGPEGGYEVPTEFVLDAFVEREAWELAGDHTGPRRARVRFTYPASLAAERRGLGEPVEHEEDGAKGDQGARDGASCVRKFEVRRPGPFLRWLLSLGGQAEILEPAEWRQRLRKMAAEVAARHRPSAEQRTRPPRAPAPRPRREGRRSGEASGGEDNP